MTALDYILEGFEKALEVERECGARAIEIDRALLVSPLPSSAPSPISPPPSLTSPQPQPSSPSSNESAPNESAPKQPPPRHLGHYPFVFLHDRPLSPGGRLIVEKTLAALKRDPQLSPVVVDGPLPKAQVYIVMGSGALHKWFPHARGTPGMWLKAEGGADILVNYSPDYILRFGALTPELDKLKHRMWNLFKSAVLRFSAPAS